MATQKTQRDGKVDRVSNVGLLGSFLVIYGSLSLAIGMILTEIVNSIFVANLISFGVVGVSSYVLLHFAMPEQMVLVDTRILHELAKRKLILFADSQRDQS